MSGPYLSSETTNHLSISSYLGDILIYFSVLDNGIIYEIIWVDDIVETGLKHAFESALELI